MNWTEVLINVPTDKTDEAAAIANMTVPYGIYIEDYSNLEQDAIEIAHIDLIDEELLKKDRQKSVIHIYLSKNANAYETLAFLRERLSAAGIEYEIDNKTVDDTSWNENWKKYFKAFEIGHRLAVCPSWETYKNPEGRTVISLDPGTAFGTGSHATTSLCLGELEKIVGEETTILDIGTGSGILAIAGLLLGAESAIGVDIDPLSVETAQKNALRNGVAGKSEFICGDLAEKITGKYDVVCANIVADVIIRLFDNVKDFMKDDGFLIISGIIDVRVEDVKMAIERYGFKTVKAVSKEEWYAFVLKK